MGNIKSRIDRAMIGTMNDQDDQIDQNRYIKAVMMVVYFGLGRLSQGLVANETSSFTENVKRSDESGDVKQ